MAFPPLGNSDHIVVSVSISFPSNSKRDVLFHGIAYDLTYTILVLIMTIFVDHLRDVPWGDIFKLDAPAAAS